MSFPVRSGPAIPELEALDDGKSFDAFHKALSRYSGVDGSWLEQARLYHQNRHLNPVLFRSVVEGLLWKLESDRKPLYSATKGLFDRLAALALVVLLSPVLVLCALAVRLSSPGPVLHRQLRLGHLGQPFWIYKFRTMFDGSDRVKRMNPPLSKIPNDRRSTPVGRFLRRRKLDELPQLLNVLLGEMSLVGPRPLLLDESATTPERYVSRYAVKPGITGLWQATRPNTIPGRRKFALDAHYVRIRGWGLDLALLLRTFGVVLRGEEPLPAPRKPALRSVPRKD